MATKISSYAHSLYNPIIYSTNINQQSPMLSTKDSTKWCIDGHGCKQYKSIKCNMLYSLIGEAQLFVWG